MAAWDGGEHVDEVPLAQRGVQVFCLVAMALVGVAAVPALRLIGLGFLALVGYFAWTFWKEPYRITVRPTGSMELQAPRGRSTHRVADVTSVVFRMGPRLELVVAGRRLRPQVSRPGELLRDLLLLNPQLEDQLTTPMRRRLARSTR